MDVVQGHLLGPYLEIMNIPTHTDTIKRETTTQNPTRLATGGLFSGVDVTGAVPVVLLVCAADRNIRSTHLYYIIHFTEG